MQCLSSFISYSNNKLCKSSIILAILYSPACYFQKLTSEMHACTSTAKIIKYGDNYITEQSQVASLIWQVAITAPFYTNLM